ncbi:unnamed protein product [Microthlaspi erraticum]|uniref:Ubiquitin-like domain-containing protein n=1 Tax=Microthlaspi erraticum TaxID=1685480 RepID=A0A6D2KK06_9BRAS|nr:unnamed protein product [Microthlaspi erraticum]
MKVSVEIITGTFIDTEVRENATVKELKEKIATDVKLSVKRLILVVGGEDERRMVMEDEDEMTLRDLGVIEDSHMYLFFKHPDLVHKEERSQGGGGGGDDASMEEISSDAENRGETEEEEKTKIDGEEEGKAMKSTEEDSRDAEVEEGEKEKNGEEEKDAAAECEKEEAKEGEEVEV